MREGGLYASSPVSTLGKLLRRATIGLLVVFSVPPGLPQNEPPIAVALGHIPVESAHAAYEGEIPALQQLYKKREYQPLWTNGTRLNAAGESALREFSQAAEEGLNPNDYLVGPITERSAKSDAVSAAELDVLVSLAVVRYAQAVGWGVTIPSEVDRDNFYDRRVFDPTAVLQGIADSQDPGAALRAFEPQTFVYRELKQALAELRAIQAQGSWKKMSTGPTLKMGDSGPRVVELRNELIARGDLAGSATGPATFDAELAAAVKRFQYRHGLTEDGVCGAAVVSEINIPVATRIQQVRLAMERLRWLPPISSGRRIAVNLADFRAYVFDGDSITFETAAVVGKRYHETPMFTASMTYLVINPYWNVPASITRNEIRPKIKADPQYLAKNHMEMTDGAVRQLPGPWNSLGRFKFMFPNSHNIYLHDTPSRTLFSLADRAFSHGCVRLQKPAELAAVLLQGQGWTPERIQATVAGGQQTVVTLDEPIPVTITYVTAFRTPDGLLHYTRDVYGRDAKLIAALERRSQGSWEQ
jgi:murein L,D-transpeptidase YcbB/YkuD